MPAVIAGIILRVLLSAFGGYLLKIGIDEDSQKQLLGPLANTIVGTAILLGTAGLSYLSKRKLIATVIAGTKVATLQNPDHAAASLGTPDEGKLTTQSGLTIDPLKKIAALLLVSLVILSTVGCNASVGEQLYNADRTVSIAARGVTAYAKSGATIAPKTKTALIAAGMTADQTLDAAHAAVDAANKAGVEPGDDAKALIAAASNFGAILTTTTKTLQGTADAHH